MNAVQDRPLAFQNLPAHVIAENRRQENQEHHAVGNVFLHQRKILQEAIQQFQQPPQFEKILENQRDVMHQLVQEAHSVRQEVKDIKGAMINALQTIRTMQAMNRQSAPRPSISNGQLLDWTRWKRLCRHFLRHK